VTRTLRTLRIYGIAFALLALMVAIAPGAGAQDFGVKQLQGKVLNGSDAPINGAIVYLENTRNNDISADTDYTVWAQFKGKKSSTKTVSSFDSRKNVYLDLIIKD
jgi:hypothetical protein